MNYAKEAFNIELLPNNRNSVIGVGQVDSMDIYLGNGTFNPQGLYSTLIFGEVGTPDRNKKFGFIDLRTTIMHPKIENELVKLKGLYGGIMGGTMYATWDNKEKDFVKSNIIDGKTGYSFFMEHFLELIHATNDSNKRDLRIQLLEKSKNKCMYDFVMVLPAGLRDIEISEDGHPTEDEINPLYRKILRAKNTINVFSHKNNDPVLDTTRKTIQKAFNEIFDYITSILAGKKGFLQSKWAARNIHGGTRNVITAMDPAPIKLGSDESLTPLDTACGLHQYLKGTVELSIFDIRNGPMEPVLQNLPTVSWVVDTKTLERKQITPSRFVNENWGTEDGIEKLMNGFAKQDARHKPIMIDGNYAALLYRDDKYFKVLYDIRDLPSDKDKRKVAPITWTEMFYISVYRSAKEVYSLVTRYPIAALGSIYPSQLFLQTTVKTESLEELNDLWQPIKNEIRASKMPIKGQPFIESMSVHPGRVPDLGADYDGDKCSLTIIMSEEAKKEIRDYLNSKEAYLNPNGSLRMGCNNPIAQLVLYNFTHGLVNHKE